MGDPERDSENVAATRPRRLLLVIHRGALAGTERHVLWLGTGLKERGWDVTLVHSEEGPILSAFREAGIESIRIRRSAGFPFSYGIRLARLARRRSIEVAHVHSGRLAALALRMVGVPAVLETRHGLGRIGNPPDARRLRAEAKRCRIAHRTLTVCQSDRSLLMRGGLDETRVVVVANGIPETNLRREEVPQRPATIRLGSIGRIAREKAPLFLVEVVSALERLRPGGWELRIAGEGPLRLQLERRVRGAGLERFVTWLGETSGPESLLRACDILLVPSEHEGQPLAILEAMRAGSVVIANNIPSLDELLGGDPPAGIVCPLDPERWAETIVSIHEDRDRSRRIAEEGKRRIVERHGLSRMIDAIERNYLDCFARSSAS